MDSPPLFAGTVVALLANAGIANAIPETKVATAANAAIAFLLNILFLSLSRITARRAYLLKQHNK